MGRFVRGVAVILAASALGSCYMPLPADPAEVGTGADLWVVLSRDGLERTQRTLPQATREMRGKLLGLSVDSLTLGVGYGEEFRGTALENASQRIPLARADIQQVSRRELHRERTALVVLAAVAALGALLAGMLDFDGSDTRPEPPPPIDTPSVIPWSPALLGAPGRPVP